MSAAMSNRIGVDAEAEAETNKGREEARTRDAVGDDVMESELGTAWRNDRRLTMFDALPVVFVVTMAPSDKKPTNK